MGSPISPIGERIDPGREGSPLMGQHQHTPQVERYAKKGQLRGVAHQAAIADPRIAIAALHQPE